MLLAFTDRLQHGTSLQGARPRPGSLLKFLDQSSVDQVMADIDGVATTSAAAGRAAGPAPGQLSEPRKAADQGGHPRPPVGQAAATLMSMPDDVAREIVLRLAYMRKVDHEVIKELQSSVMQEFLARAGHDEASLRAAA